ncbi:MAG: TfoX/Sxy family protein [Candidatus Tectomicrobia bacterium]|uniref:TfoX/Sxy family protein n=1 Tax=Tectimicrobiota bacterium TaxID=2528274 RepID=A0A932GN28_UNCTE|nr:TfoX/Sxy family protein [Candidatus Tectomicrobia bacterium]
MKDDSFTEFIRDQLRDLGEVECRAMFGGYGLYHGEVFFAITFKGRLYFKTDPTTLPAYRKMGMKPFRPNARQTLKTYYEVPVDIIEDQDQLTAWARKALEAQIRSENSRGRGR